MAQHFGAGASPFLIAGPCVVESDDLNLRVGEALADLAAKLGLHVIYKASYDKANRSRLKGARGPGPERGLAALAKVRATTGLAILTDVHETGHVAAAAQVADVLQIPAFLCRQTDLLVAAGRAGRAVNVKKGQWMAPEGMAGAVEKVRSGGAPEIAVTERGTFFGYGDLVVDMRSFARLRAACGTPVVYDGTHAVQQPGQGPDAAAALCRRRSGRRRLFPRNASRSGPRAVRRAEHDPPESAGGHRDVGIGRVAHGAGGGHGGSGVPGGGRGGCRGPSESRAPRPRPGP